MDVARDSELAIKGSRVRCTLPDHNFLAMRVTPSGSGGAATTDSVSTAVGPSPDQASNNPSDWETNKDAPGVSVESGVRIGDSQYGVRLSSTIYQASAIAAFKRPVADQGTLIVMIVRSGRLGINVAGVNLIFDGGWVPATDPLNTGSFNLPSANPDKRETLAISWRNGVIDMVYGDQVVARNLTMKRPGKRDRLELSTWGGDWFTFEPLEVSNRPTVLFPKAVHPVL